MDPGDLFGTSESEVKRRMQLEELSGTIPATALNFSFCQFISRHLDADDNLRCQDWRGFAEKVGLTFQEIQRLRNKENKVLEILESFQRQSDSSIGQLIAYLRELQRFDILEDPEFWDLLAANIQSHQDANKKRIQKSVSPVQDNRISSTTELTQFVEPDRRQQRRPPDPAGYLRSQRTDHNVDECSHIVTGDVMSQGKTFFDAFVAYTHTDIKFVKRMIAELETPKFDLSLCVNARDLLPGTPFYTVTAKLIEERCKRIIIVLSPDFMYDPICDFYVKFAHSLSPGSRSKKLIPVLTNHCFIPQILRYITLVDYTKSDLQEWFWERLARSLQAPLVFLEEEKFTNEDLSEIELALPPQTSRYVSIAPPRSSSQQQPQQSSMSDSTHTSGYGSSSASCMESRHEPSNMEVPVDSSRALSQSRSQSGGSSSAMATVAIVHSSSPSPSHLPFANSPAHGSTPAASSCRSGGAAGDFLSPPASFCDPPEPPSVIRRKGSDKSLSSQSSDMMATEDLNHSTESMKSCDNQPESNRQALRPVAQQPPRKKWHYFFNFGKSKDDKRKQPKDDLNPCSGVNDEHL